MGFALPWLNSIENFNFLSLSLIILYHFWGLVEEGFMQKQNFKEVLFTHPYVEQPLPVNSITISLFKHVHVFSISMLYAQYK